MLMLFLFVPSLIWTLMVYNLSVETESVMRVQHQEKEKVSSSLKRPAWVNTIRALRWSATLAFMVTVLCCSFVFVVFPRFNFQGFRGQFLQPVHKTGFTSQVDLGGSGKIFTDESIVMRVEINPSDVDSAGLPERKVA